MNNYEDRIVCFLDILGFKELIKKTINNDREDVTETDKIIDIFNFVKDELHPDPYGIKKIANDRYASIKDKYKMTHFSDSVVISMSLKEISSLYRIIERLLFFILEALKYNLFLRGALVVGKLHHSNDIVFGPSLNRAYDLEKDKAIYPRIILDDELIDTYLNEGEVSNNIEDERQYIEEILRIDSDGNYYIDYFNVDSELFDSGPDLFRFFEYLRGVIINNIKEYDCDKNIKRKNTWLKNKFNEMIVLSNTKYRIKIQKKFGIHKIERRNLLI